MESIKEMMKSKGIKSYDELAKMILKPKSKNKTFRSLGNQLRNLDKGKTDYWKGKGREFIEPLARELKIDISEFNRLIYKEEPSIIQFSNFPDIPQLDLSKEDLPPGLPKVFNNPVFGQLDPYRFTRWTYQSDLEKEIIIKWLENRKWFKKGNLEDLDKPTNNKIWIEIDKAEKLNNIKKSKLEQLSALCVMINMQNERTYKSQIGDENINKEPVGFNYYFKNKDEDKADLFNIISPSVDEYFDEFVEWFGERVTKGGGFSKDDILNRKNDILRLVSNFEELLEILYIINQIGTNNLSNSKRFVKEYFRLKIENNNTNDNNNRTSLIINRGHEFLCITEKTRVMNYWPTSMNKEQWIKAAKYIGLKKEEYEEYKRIKSEDLRKIIISSKNISDDFIKYLIKYKILSSRDGNQYELTSTWLKNLIFQEIFIETFQSSGIDWTYFLFYKEYSSKIIKKLIEEFSSNNYTKIKEAIAHLNINEPNSVLAIDAIFRAIGISIAKGTTFQDNSIVEEIWKNEMKIVIERYNNFPPVPLINIQTKDSTNNDFLTTLGCYLFSAQIISEYLYINNKNDTLKNSDPSLSPWIHKSPPENLNKVLEIISYDGIYSNYDIIKELYSLGSRLFDKFGVLNTERYPLLQEPTIFVHQATGQISPIIRSFSLPFSFPVDILKEECNRRNISYDNVIDYFWQNYISNINSGKINNDDYFAYKKDELLEIIKTAPEEFFNNNFFNNEYQILQYILSNIDKQTWEKIGNMIKHKNISNKKYPDIIWEKIPEEKAIELIKSTKIFPIFLSRILDILWKRMPKHLIGLIITEYENNNLSENISEVIYHTPDQHQKELFTLIKKIIDNKKMIEKNIVIWLYDLVDKRVHFWKDVYSLLVKYSFIV